MKFVSKKDWWIFFILFGAVIALYTILLINMDIYIALACIPVSLLILWFWFTTFYVITDTKLVIRSAFIHINISVYDIQSIQKITNILSSPALSLDRLKIVYDSEKSVLISPKNRGEFLEELLKLNPSIEVENKK
ncbi:PH domain-containing protein [Rummeliibacillus suwonensis]|uniref:PH domain-containing protein n=1 Tax=Rummeliibacillus suwonensis TaxID=1306154 RepID=UPI001AAF47F2|nr:PH domain-containing protein [Rummeliibacillus suwonensis]MBO2535233.1 PH domain-containing protein [Rummeliibacillus suwonensis]